MKIEEPLKTQEKCYQNEIPDSPKSLKQNEPDQLQPLINEFEKLNTKSKEDLLQYIMQFNVSKDSSLNEKSNLDKKPSLKRKFGVAFRKQVAKDANECNNNYATARKFKLPEATVRYWRLNLSSKDELQKSYLKKQKRVRSRNLINMENELISWFKEMRNKKLAVSVASIKVKALEFAKGHGLSDSTFKASSNWVGKFKERYKIVMRSATHIATKLSNYAVDEIKTFLDKFRQIKIEEVMHQMNNSLDDSRSTLYINLDEVPLMFDVSKNKTLDFKGVRDVTILKNKKYKSRMTVLLSVVSNGDFLSPFVIGKSMSKKTKEINCYLNLFHSSNSNSWMTTTMFIEYLKLVIIPYKRKTMGKIILIMDKFSVHTNSTVQDFMKNSNINYEYIPAGCTGFLQPLDVTINRVFKDGIRAHYDEFLSETLQVTQEQNQIYPPSKENFYSWIVGTLAKMEKNLIINSFKHCGINIGYGENELVNKKLTSINEIQQYFEQMEEREMAKLDGIEEIIENPEETDFNVEDLKEDVIDNSYESDSLSDSKSETTEQLTDDTHQSKSENVPTEKNFKIYKSIIKKQTSLDGFVVVDKNK
jgi:hypothetical protein